MRLSRIGALVAVLAMAGPPARAAWIENGVVLSDESSHPYSLVSVSDGVGGMFVAWHDSRSGSPDVYAQHVTADGEIAAGWPVDGLAVTQAPGEQWVASIASDRAGGVFVAWTDEVSRRVLMQRIGPSGMPAPDWSVGGMTLDPDTGPGAQNGVLVVEDGSGGAIAVWRDAHRLRARGVDGPGTLWPSNTAVCDSPTVTGYQAVVGDGAGGVIIVWLDAPLLPSGRHGDRARIRAQRVTAGGGLAAGWPEGGTVLTDSVATSDPHVVTDGSSGAIVVFKDGGRILAQRVTAAGERAWPGSGMVVSGPNSVPEGVGAAGDGEGGVIVGWAEGAANDLRAQRLSPSGVSLWPTDGALLCHGPGSRYIWGWLAIWATPVVADGAGGAYVGWDDHRPTDAGLDAPYVQHLRADGKVAPGWELDGVRFAVDTGWGDPPTLVPDGEGGALVAWVATQDGGRKRIRALSTTGPRPAPGPPWMLVGAHALTPDGVMIDAETSPREGLTCTLERRSDSYGEFQALESRVPDAAWKVRFLDRTVEPGTTYEYRLALSDGTVRVTTGLIQIIVPAGRPTFSLRGTSTNPTRDRTLLVECTAPDAAPLRLELFDIRGARVSEAITVPPVLGGRVMVALGNGVAMRPGVYLVRVTREGQALSRRIVLLQ